MIGIERIQKEGRSAKRGEGGGYLLSHMTALANTCNDELSLTFIYHFHCFLKIVVEQWNEVQYGLCLISEAFYSKVLYFHIT